MVRVNPVAAPRVSPNTAQGRGGAKSAKPQATEHAVDPIGVKRKSSSDTSAVPPRHRG